VAEEEKFPTLRNATVGYNGLSVIAGQVLEEEDKDLRWPQSIKTFKKMLKHGTIAPAVDYVQTMIARVPWYVKPAEGYEDEHKPYVKSLTSMMGDMDDSWLYTIKNITSFVPFGFAAVEIVPRYRLRSRGSKYNDGLVGLKKLALRSQDSLVGWEYKNKGRDLAGVWQRVNIPAGVEDRQRINVDGEKTKVLIPIEKMLLFRNNPLKDNPEGRSPLASIYRSWKYLTAYEENQANSVSADVHGLKVLYMPPQYMSDDAPQEYKNIYEEYKNIMRNMHIGKESCMILPQIVDDVSGEQFFKFEIINATGQKANDVRGIIEDYKKEILTALYADFLIMGQEGGGSYALSESKLSVVELMIEAKLEEIRDVFNHKLIPLLFRENGWETDVYPTFEFGDVSDISLAEWAKAFQQISAGKGIPKVPSTINETLAKMGFSYRVPEGMSKEELFELLEGGENGAGEGMEEGLGSGTGKGTKGGDKSAGNANNK
jgi:hypothetical protein